MTGLSDLERPASDSEVELLASEASTSELLDPGLGHKLRPAGLVLAVRSRAPAAGEEEDPVLSLSTLTVAVSRVTVVVQDCSSGCTASPAEEGPSALSQLQI